MVISFIRVIIYMKQSDKKIHKYFHVGDIVICEYLWDKKLFIIDGFGGNWYLPELYVHPYNLKWSPGNSCNFDVRKVKLVGAEKRPFKKLSMHQLTKIKSNNDSIKEEVKREIFIRINEKYV